jgi:regulator of protease activity HflC (stomatin/prohibitin superfamily)
MLDQLLNVIAIVAWAWFALVVVVIAIRAYQAGGLRELGLSLISMRVILALFVALVLSMLSASLIFIQPQEVGVVISVISPNGYREEPLRSGLHAIVPLAEKVVLYPIYWQTYTMSSEPLEGGKVGNDSIVSRTSDGQVVNIDSSVIFRIDANEVIRVHIDLQNRYVDDFIRPIMRGYVRTEVSQFTADEVNSSKRKQLEENLDQLLREQFSLKGFVLDHFLLRNISFSPQYASALEQKQVAEQDQIQREYQAEQMRKLAEGERDKLKLEAEGRAAAVEREAKAQATAIVLKGQADATALQYVSDVLKRNKDLIVFRYVDKIAQGIKVMLVPSDNPYLLPLPDIMGEETLTEEPTSSPELLTPTPVITSTVTVTPVPTGTP